MLSNLRSSIYVMRENFHLSCKGKAKEGNYLSSCRRGGGGRGLPEKIFEKRMQMVHSELIFAEFVSNPPPPPKKKKKCVIFAFNAPISMMREIFFLSHGVGVGVPLVFFFWKRIHEFHVSFRNHYYWKLRYRWHWVIGFHFILIFSHPSLFLSVLSLPPQLLCPSHSLQTPNLPFPLSTPHLPARRLIAVAVTGPWIWRPIR